MKPLNGYRCFTKKVVSQRQNRCALFLKLKMEFIQHVVDTFSRYKRIDDDIDLVFIGNREDRSGGNLQRRFGFFLGAELIAKWVVIDKLVQLKLADGLNFRPSITGLYLADTARIYRPLGRVEVKLYGLVGISACDYSLDQSNFMFLKRWSGPQYTPISRKNKTTQYKKIQE